jgi:hypothetical protein
VVEGEIGVRSRNAPASNPMPLRQPFIFTSEFLQLDDKRYKSRPAEEDIYESRLHWTGNYGG